MASTLTVDTIQGSTTADTVKLPKGGILQVENTILQGTVASSTTQQYVDVMSLAITPKFATSKILVQVSGCLSNDSQANMTMLKLLRGTTKIAAGNVSSTADYNGSAFFAPPYDPAGATNTHVTGGFAINFLDSPATTSATTYKIQIGGWNGIARVGVRGDTPGTAGQSMPTYFTLMEIAQ